MNLATDESLRMDKLIIGCGYLGQRIAKLWLDQGHRVFATTRTKLRADQLSGLGIEPIVCDVLKPASLRVLPAVDTVVHSIALDRQSGRTMREVYVDGLTNTLAQLSKGGRFIYVSSSSVYGQTNEELVDEEAPTAPLEESGKVVLEAEQTLKHHLPEAIILRFSGIYGPGRLLRRHTLVKSEPIVGDPDKWLNLIHVEDGAKAVLAAETNAKTARVYNVADDMPVRRRDFYRALARLLGAAPPTFVLPNHELPPPSHERANRRINNRRLRDELKVNLLYPTYEVGLPASI
jgi:nucleoside-diphosphate-sugar epimerase